MASETEKKEPEPENKSPEKQPEVGEGNAEGTTDASKTIDAEGPKDDGEGKQGGTGGENVKDDEDVPQSFPQRLLEILSNEEQSGIISWLPHGKGFIIREKKRFAEDILPKYFKKSKFTSFTRKLNRWNFVRVTRGPETGAYYHPLFQKGDTKLCTQMTCISSKSPQQLQPMNPVALGLGTPGQYYPDMTADPATMARMQEQRQAFMAQQWQQQQAFMAMMAQQQQQATTAAARSGKEGSEEKGDDAAGAQAEESKEGEEQKQQTNQPNPAAMMAFQQQQYYAMFMAHQQQMAAMAAQMPPQQQQAFGFMNMGGNAPGNEPANAPEKASGEGDASGDAKDKEQAPAQAEGEQAAGAEVAGAVETAEGETRTEGV